MVKILKRLHKHPKTKNGKDTETALGHGKNKSKEMKSHDSNRHTYVFGCIKINQSTSLSLSVTRPPTC